MSGLAIALAFLTRLPTRWLGAVPDADTAPRDSSAGPPRAGLSAAAPWLPATGALIGTIVALAVSLGALVSPWVGALAGLVAWIAVTLLFRLYVSQFGSYNETYGSLAGVIVSLFWLWLTAVMVLLGAEINAETEHQTAEDTTVGGDQPIGQRGAVKADTLGEFRC